MQLYKQISFTQTLVKNATMNDCYEKHDQKDRGITKI